MLIFDSGNIILYFLFIIINRNFGIKKVFELLLVDLEVKTLKTTIKNEFIS